MPAPRKETTRFDLKKLAGVVALIATLFGGLGSAVGWYSAQIQEDTISEMKQEALDKRVESLEDRFEVQEEKLDDQIRRSIRSEVMLETLLSDRGLDVPPTANPPE